MDAPDLHAWDPWTPDDVFQMFRGIPAPWCVVGGWAIDLWLGRQTRHHEDIEIAVLPQDVMVFRSALPGCEFYSAGSGKITHLGRKDLPEGMHQMWCLDCSARVWRLDIMIEPGDAETWRYRRDPSLFRDRNTAVSRTASGIPYLRPELVLLFKARHMREKDEADFSSALPGLGEEKRWLADALRRFHPGHAWISRLQDQGG